MSFKKTPDGKVFFKGASANANANTSANAKVDTTQDDDLDLVSLEGRALGAETQLQILALLRALNDKLRTTQAQHSKFDNQLETFRGLLESLDERTQANEKALSTLDQRPHGPGIGAAIDTRGEDIENILRETRAELQRTRQIFLRNDDKRELPGSAYRDALGGLARAEQLLTTSEKAEAAEPGRQMYFSAFYAAALSLLLISGAIFVWGLTGYETGTPARGLQTAGTLQETGVTSEDQLLRLMETNPDALATELNKMEPGSTSGTEDMSDVHGLIEPDATLPASYRALEEKAFSGSMEAQHNLAALYTAVNGPVKQDYERAGFWFRQAAERGMANAQYNLGVMYHQGLGVAKDLAQAVSWYKAAAAQHHAEAEYNLGIAYIQGIGVEYDPVKAVKNFEDAARLGVVEASYNLGLIYENALLGRAEPSKALAWYKKAADAGSPEATAALQQLARTLDIDMKDIDRVIAEQGNRG